jgi:hypothetical protein
MPCLAEPVSKVPATFSRSRLPSSTRDQPGRAGRKRRRSLRTGAVARTDTLPYDEPPVFLSPARVTGRRVAERNADEAERVFRADLARHPRNARSLFGLYELRKQGRYATRLVKRASTRY